MGRCYDNGDMADKKIISLPEQQKILLEMLRFLDRICRKNKIKYSLINASLIGAIRHQGFVPWDDDIDVVLTKENYDKLKKILDKETGRYQTLKQGKGGERYGFLKLIDTHTQALEKNRPKFNPNYGIYIDITCYYPTSDGKKEQSKQFRKLKLLFSLYLRRKIFFKEEPLSKIILCLGKNACSKILGYNRINRRYNKLLNKYSDGKKYVISNWPVYGFENEIQLAKNTEEYIDVKFEGVTVMVFKEYDEILKTIYGDYMKMPPKNKRVPKHNITAWWRED